MAYQKADVLTWKKRVWQSQNFLTAQRLNRHIVNLSTITKADRVLEIGTGKGHITQVLCQKSAFVESVEIDEKLYRKAHERLKGEKNVKLVLGDFLKYSLPQKGEYKVFANIPFFLTTQIIDKLTRAQNPPKDMWLVMEKGAAKRFMGTPRENSTSLLLKLFWQTERVHQFKREDFHPKPDADTVMVHFHKKERPLLEKKEQEAYQRFINHGIKYGLLGRRDYLVTSKSALL